VIVDVDFLINDTQSRVCIHVLDRCTAARGLPLQTGVRNFNGRSFYFIYPEEIFKF
jgi:hypothetical protein